MAGISNQICRFCFRSRTSLIRLANFHRPYMSYLNYHPRELNSCDSSGSSLSLRVRCTGKISNNKRSYGVRSGQSFTTNQATEQFVQWLMPEERKALFRALAKYQTAQEKEDQAREDNKPPSLYQLQLVVFCNAVPFIGFGFLDNAIMILAGDYIDKTIGITFGISTMAAAALGNLISDLLGIGLAGYVETLAGTLGFDMPPLTPKQASMWQTIYSSYTGRALGIVVGCLLGMFPLFFLEDEADNDDKETEKEK